MKKELQTLLFVEDDANDALLIRQALHSIDATMRIQIAHDGVNALEYLDGKGKFADRTRFEFPFLVITDINMPRMDGLTLLEAIRKRPDRGTVPVVILSSGADPLDIT